MSGNDDDLFSKLVKCLTVPSTFDRHVTLRVMRIEVAQGSVKKTGAQLGNYVKKTTSQGSDL